MQKKKPRRYALTPTRTEVKGVRITRFRLTPSDPALARLDNRAKATR